MNVLIVDDNATNRKLVRVNLEVGGYSWLEAADGVEALAVLEQQPVDAVVSDILMPRMDGYQLCSQVRMSDRFRSLPFIVYTGSYTSPADEKLALDLGADRYLRKPAPLQVLLDALEDACTRAASRKRAAQPLPEELITLRECSAALVRKLEERNVELENTQKSLAKLNDSLERQVRERTAELAERTAALEAANDSLQAFAHSVSHDLKTPVRHIISFGEFIREDPGNKLTESSGGDLQSAMAAARDLSHMIDALLSFSECGQRRLHTIRVELKELVEKARCGLEIETGNRQVVWKIGALPSVKADPILIRQVLANLLSNAVKYTGPRPVAEIEIGRLGEGRGEVLIFVRDNGVGFDMAYAERLFGVFQRLHSQRDFEGTGIGLATARRIVERHGGKMWAESRPGQGATFFFTLPT